MEAVRELRNTPDRAQKHPKSARASSVLASDGMTDPDELRRQVLASFPLA